jgi:hypothetical protein
VARIAYQCSNDDALRSTQGTLVCVRAYLTYNCIASVSFPYSAHESAQRFTAWIITQTNLSHFRFKTRRARTSGLAFSSRLLIKDVRMSSKPPPTLLLRQSTKASTHEHSVSGRIQCILVRVCDVLMSHVYLESRQSSSAFEAFPPRWYNWTAWSISPFFS